MAAFACGAVNAVAGGGSLILFPALVASGLPTLSANVTNAVATWPGYLGGVLGFREELKDQKGRLVTLSLFTVAGSLSGCVLLLTTPSEAFDSVVPALVLFATGLLWVQPRVKKWMARRAPTKDKPNRGLYPALFLAAIYGGYFGGALGVIVISALALTMVGELPKLNALKGALSLVNCTVTVVIFSLFGPVVWSSVALAAPCTLLGGYAGARFARRLNDKVLRWSIIGLGLAVSIYLYLQI